MYEAKREAGFTVIELLIAFTILAIISGSLFQMFYVSARNNAEAVDFDMGNNLAISAAELFKAGSDTGSYIRFYDSSWQELSYMPPVPGFAAETPADAHFVLEAKVEENSGGSGDLNYVAAALTLSLDASQDYRLVINGGAGGIEAAFNGIPQQINASKIGRVISVNVEFTREGLLPKNIVVVNRTDLTVNMNIFGVPGADNIDAYTGAGSGEGTGEAESGGAGSGAGTGTGEGVGSGAGAGSSEDANDSFDSVGASDGGGISGVSGAVGASGAVVGDSSGEGNYGAFVEVSPVSGAVGVMFLGEMARAADSVMRNLTVSVREVRQDGLELARIEASKYVPG